MSSITAAFALTLNPVYFHFMNAATKDNILWRANNKGGYTVDINRTSSKDFLKESEAWVYADANFPDLVGTLERSAMATWRGYGMRAKMILALGEASVEAMKQDLYADLLGMFDTAMLALDATKVSKAKLNVMRMCKMKGVSWLDVRTRVTLPFHHEPLLLSVRFLASPIEEKTFSIRLRLPSETDLCVQETQLRFDELVRKLGYQGITVKDVQNGTCMDL